MKVKLLKKGIKVDGKYYPCWYSSGKNNLKGNATIYIKTYDPLPEGLDDEMQVVNDSDIRTDYMMKDHIRIASTSKYFATVEKLAEAYKFLWAN